MKYVLTVCFILACCFTALCDETNNAVTNPIMAYIPECYRLENGDYDWASYYKSLEFNVDYLKYDPEEHPHSWYILYDDYPPITNGITWNVVNSSNVPAAQVEFVVYSVGLTQTQEHMLEGEIRSAIRKVLDKYFCVE